MKPGRGGEIVLLSFEDAVHVGHEALVLLELLQPVLPDGRQQPDWAVFGLIELLSHRCGETGRWRRDSSTTTDCTRVPAILAIRAADSAAR